MKELEAKDIMELAKVEKVESIKIGDEVFSLNDELEIVWYCGKPAVYMGEEDHYYYILMLESGECEYKLCDGDFKRNDNYIYVGDLVDLMNDLAFENTTIEKGFTNEN